MALNDAKELICIVSVDTEEEFRWDGPLPQYPFSVKNIQNVPKFQEFCYSRGIKPTYFVDYAIASDPTSAEILKAISTRKECEIGAHLHPWATPPINEMLSKEYSHTINLPEELIREKMKNLTKTLAEVFGERPNSFRAGRWGINGTILKILVEEGYQIDSSIRPYYSDVCFDYSDAPGQPYWPDFSKVTTHGEQREIFEIPVTSGFNHRHFTFYHKVHRFLSHSPWTKLHAIGILWHTNILRKVRLSPELTDAPNMIQLIRKCVKRGYTILNLFLHSSSFLIGGSPYVKNEQEEEQFYKNMDAVFAFLKQNYSVRYCTITEAKQLYLQKNIDKI